MSDNVDPVARNVRDMSSARAKTGIEVNLVRDYLYESNEKWLEHSSVITMLSRDAVFEKSQRLYMNRRERYKRGLKIINRIHELKVLNQWSLKQFNDAVGLSDEQLPMHLHNVAFEPVFMSQGSPQLLAKYGDLVANQGVLGCYLQTELGHGSNVSELETTATYLPETREFDIHSPTLSSSKWWIGGAGKTATHGVLQAKLILPGGKDAGPHLFFVQLRSLKDHTTMPGITLGDIGPKAMGGFAPTDNGFVRFDHVRIPHEHMLSKFAQVTADGQYVKPPHAKIGYGGMMYIRSTMIGSIGWTTAKAATIAIRYATVRRQGNKDIQGLESQIITYPSVYARLLPILSRAYVWIFLGRNLDKAFAEMSSRLASGDTSLLAEMHATTSGLKVLVTTASIQDVETARRCLGGHGFSAYAGFGRIYANHLPSATYEGDNFVLDQQVVRAAIKAYKAFASAKSPSASMLSPSTYYLRLLSPGSGGLSKSSGLSWEDPPKLVMLLERRAAHIVRHRAQYEHDPDATADQRVSKAVTEAFVAAQVQKFITDASKALPESTAKVIIDLFTLYLLTLVERALVDLLSFNLLTGEIAPVPGPFEDPTRALRKAIQSLCLKLLPQAIGLSDAFGFTDWELDSSLGVYSGKVYESLWEKAQTEPLNKTDVPDGYEEYIKPMLERGRRLASRGGAKL